MNYRPEFPERFGCIVHPGIRSGSDNMPDSSRRNYPTPSGSPPVRFPVGADPRVRPSSVSVWGPNPALSADLSPIASAKGEVRPGLDGRFSLRSQGYYGEGGRLDVGPSSQIINSLFPSPLPSFPNALDASLKPQASQTLYPRLSVSQTSRLADSNLFQNYLSRGGGRAGSNAV